MVPVYKSRFTPGARGDEVHLEIGEVVQFQLLNGTVIDVTIDSPRMTHDQCPTYGYEYISGTGGRCFADGARIIGWDGKVE